MLAGFLHIEISRTIQWLCVEINILFNTWDVEIIILWFSVNELNKHNKSVKTKIESIDTFKPG